MAGYTGRPAARRRGRARLVDSYTDRQPRASRCGPRPPSRAGNAASRGWPAGSRVLLVLPPGLGYGQAGDRPDVDGHDTLIFAVGILAAL
jgi:hypothetical protein